MKSSLLKLLGRASDLVDTEPLIALFLGAALIAVFLTTFLRSKPTDRPASHPGLLGTLYDNAQRLLWALLLTGSLVAAVTVLRVYLRHGITDFQRTHGRITQANYEAVQTIWGAEQEQRELKVELYTEEEVTERIESEDLTRPAVLRKKTVRHPVTANPFITARHDVRLTQNPRRKGSAYYGGYETICHFAWKLSNPADSPQKCNLIFPLPAAGAMYDDLTASLNGEDVLPKMQLKDATLVLAREAKPNEVLDFKISFKSRGVSFWYFQVREAREIRDFTLSLTLPDLPKDKLNYPGGCMTPTEIQSTPDSQGSLLTFRLDHAISSQGMGVALPSLPQPGETTSAVLGETERAWLMIFATLCLTLVLAQIRQAVLVTILFGSATAFAYGLFGGFSDLLFGFVGTALLVLVPFLVGLARLLMRVLPDLAGKMLASQFVIIGVVYPCVAGLDPDRQALYLNLCAVVFLGFTAWLLTRRLLNLPIEPASIGAAPAV